MRWRTIQQSWAFHAIQAALAGAGVAAFSCFAVRNEFSMACVYTGLISAGLTFFASIQHSPGSTAFNSDGSTNIPVQKVVEAQKKGEEVAVAVNEKIVVVDGPTIAGG